VKVSDETLVSGVLSGDREAFGELYDRKAKLIRAVCYDATHDLVSAADLAQEAFLRAYRGLGELRNPSLFSPWLLGIARQVCREWRRSRQRQPESLDEYQPVASTDGIARRGLDSDDVMHLRDAIAGLPERERLALHAFYLLEMDAEETRGILSLSRSGLYRVLSRARRRLRRVLVRHEVHS
jgi:RNA polymerase sigma-70 factor (ECF subfamily)